MYNFMKLRPVGAELFYANRRTMMKLTLAFRYFAKAHKNESIWGGGEQLWYRHPFTGVP